MIITAAPPERAGSASGISETSSELGGALGIAILGSIGTIMYRRQLAGVLPAAVPSVATAAARDTLGGAVAVASQLPDQVGAELLAAARGAFADALALTAGICAAVTLATAVAAAVLFRRVGT